jgi:hypothetical protein
MSGRPKALAGIGACAVMLGACGGGAGGETSVPQAPITHAAVARGSAPGDWTRFGYDPQRSGVGPADTGITAANVASLGRRTMTIDGVADSSPIGLHAVMVRGRRRDVAILTTTYGRTIAIDLGTGHKVWEFVPRDVHAYQGSSQITTASPVSDPNRRFVYAASPDGLIRKIGIADGREIRGRYLARQDHVRSHPREDRRALNLTGRNVVAVTGGYYGDAPSYQGHVVLIDRRTGRIGQVWNSCAQTAKT